MIEIPARYEASERVNLGRIIKPHGIRGEVRVEPWVTHVETLLTIEEVWLEGRRESSIVESARPHKKRVLMKFQGVDDRDAAELLRGLCLQRPEEQSPTLDEDWYYLHELEGCEVRLVEGDRLGTVRSVEEAGSNVMFVVEPDSDAELQPKHGTWLIPFVEEIVPEVDVEEKVVYVTPTAGLLDL